MLNIGDNQGMDSAKKIVEKTRAQLKEKGIESDDLSKKKPIRIDKKTIIYK